MPQLPLPPGRGPSRRPSITLLIGIGLTLCASVAVASVPAQQPDEPGGYASTHVVIKVRPGFRPAFAAGRWTVAPFDGPVAGAAQGPGLSLQEREAVDREVAGLEAELERWPTMALSAAAPVVPDTPTARQLGLDRYYLVHVPRGTDTPALAEALGRFDRVIEVAHLDGIGGVADTVPDDEHFGLQYGLLNEGQNVAGQPGLPGADIKATLAWDLTRGTDAMVLGVLDAGVDPHVELAGKLVEPGWAFDGGDPGDTCVSHGTHVSGIAAASADNGLGIAGTNWNMRVQSFRVLAGCNGNETDTAFGVLEAVAQGVDVINMSLQFSAGSQFFKDAILTAYAADIPMIAASGNNGFSGGVAYPARWAETIAVAATDNQDERAAFSNMGPELDVAAPGDAIYSLFGTSSYAFKNGTSMATPFVSGLVGLMRTLDPDLTTEEIRTILRDTADDVEDPGFDTLTGYGRVNAYAALLAVEEMGGVSGDVTGDGLVNVTDLIAVILAFGPCEGECPADLDGDGEVDVPDLILVVVNWTG